MKLPRDLSARNLVNILKNYGYQVTRQSGSHIRLTTYLKGEHHITIPNHDSLKIGTLNAILNDIATHLDINKDNILEK